jgi:hypothetical protein
MLRTHRKNLYGRYAARRGEESVSMALEGKKRRKKKRKEKLRPGGRGHRTEGTKLNCSDRHSLGRKTTMAG